MERPETTPTSVTVVPTEWVEGAADYCPRRFEATLMKQGLIEPLIIDAEWHVGAKPYDAEYLRAAINLGWDTVIVVHAHWE